MTAETAPKRTWGQALAVYAERPVLSMLFLGFSAGLPFYLVFSTLSAWLRTAHIERATIGMLAWVGLMYSFKWAWAPIVDRVGLPALDRLLGRRRSWMLVAQIGVAVCLFNVALSDPAASIAHIAIFSLGVAFFAATQDIAVDAWRIESAAADKQGAMAGAYQVGYRIGLITASAGALSIAAEAGWRASYFTMAALMGIGVVTTLLVHEPQRLVAEVAVNREQRVIDWIAARSHWPRWAQSAGAWFVGAVAGPVVDFFGRYGLALGLLIFAFISSYRLTDYVMGTMTNTFYVDLGFSLKEIAVVAKLFGLPTALIGAVIGGVLVAKLGRVRALVLGSVLVIVSNIFYATMGAYGCQIPLECAQTGLIDFWPHQFTMRGPATDAGLAFIVGFDNIAIGIHGTSLIAFMSSLTSAKYTATQYAVLSSLYSLPGKLLMGTSGFVVDALGYGDFFLYTALLSIPGLLLLMWLSRRDITAAARN
jgi:MFS transporter, PAT family, beta-lactamase induction signal transducer AmpG